MGRKAKPHRGTAQEVCEGRKDASEVEQRQGVDPRPLERLWVNESEALRCLYSGTSREWDKEILDNEMLGVGKHRGGGEALGPEGGGWGPPG